jgi:hypothetical protein
LDHIADSADSEGQRGCIHISAHPQQGRKRKLEDPLDDSGYGTPGCSNTPIKRLNAGHSHTLVSPMLISEIESAYEELYKAVQLGLRIASCTTISTNK